MPNTTGLVVFVMSALVGAFIVTSILLATVTTQVRLGSALGRFGLSFVAGGALGFLTMSAGSGGVLNFLIGMGGFSLGGLLGYLIGVRIRRREGIQDRRDGFFSPPD